MTTEGRWEHFPHGADMGVRGVGSVGRLSLDAAGMDAMLAGGARWAVDRGYGRPADLERIEEHGCADGLGHQIGRVFLKRMVIEAPRHGLVLPDRELASAPIRSPLGQAYLGAMRAAINCALANRQVLTHLVRHVFAHRLPAASVDRLYDVSHNTCKVEAHAVNGDRRPLYAHRKGATRACGPGHPDLPPAFSAVGQPVLIGGTMGTASCVLAGTPAAEARSFGSSCHGRLQGRHGRGRGRRCGRPVTTRRAARAAHHDQGVSPRAPRVAPGTRVRGRARLAGRAAGRRAR